MLVAWTSQFLSKPGGLPGPAGSAGLLAVVSYTKSRQEANFDSRFWRGIKKTGRQGNPHITRGIYKAVFTENCAGCNDVISYSDFSQQLSDNVECRYSSRRSERSPCQTITLNRRHQVNTWFVETNTVAWPAALSFTSSDAGSRGRGEWADAEFGGCGRDGWVSSWGARHVCSICVFAQTAGRPSFLLTHCQLLAKVWQDTRQDPQVQNTLHVGLWCHKYEIKYCLFPIGLTEMSPLKTWKDVNVMSA